MSNPSLSTASPAASETAPPPPPPFYPQPSPRQLRILVALFCAGVVAFAIGLLVPRGYDQLVQRGGMFLAVYSLVVGASWLPPNLLTKRIDALLDRWVRGSASGYYGMMALATFVHLEMKSFFGAIVDFEFGLDTLRDAALQWVTGFSVDSIMNLAWGFGWPGNIFQNRAGLAPLVLVALTWAVFNLGRRWLPHANFQARKQSSSKP